MELETFKINCRAYFPNCKFVEYINRCSRKGTIVEAFISADNELTGAVHDWMFAKWANTEYLSKCIWAWNLGEDYCRPMKERKWILKLKEISK